MSLPYKVKLRPSDASRWTVCTVSPHYVGLLDAQGKLPEEKPRDYTDEGSRAHELAEKLLTQPDPSLIKDCENIHVKGYCEYVLGKISSAGSTILVETMIETYYNPDQTGYIDAIVVDPTGAVVDIVDLKYGQGVDVAARGNKQLAIYGYSWATHPDAEMLYGVTDDTLLRMTIYQPRTDGETVKQWNITLDELASWLEENVTDKAARILTADDPSTELPLVFCPSEDACRFCPAKAICPAHAGYSLGEFGENDEVSMDLVKEFAPKALARVNDLAIAHTGRGADEKNLPLVEALSPEQINSILLVGPRVKKWIDQVQEFAIGGLKQGILALDGFKLVESRTHRRWSDEDDAYKFLKRYGKAEEVSTRKVITPAQAEKFMGAKEFKRNKEKILSEFAELIVKPEGGLSLAPVGDKRESKTTAQDLGLTDETEPEAMEAPSSPATLSTILPIGTLVETTSKSVVEITEHLGGKLYLVSYKGRSTSLDANDIARVVSLPEPTEPTEDAEDDDELL